MEAEKKIPYDDAASFMLRVQRLDKASRAELRHACGKGLNEASTKALFAFYSCFPPRGYLEPIYFIAACLSCMNVSPLPKIALEAYLHQALQRNESLSSRVIRLLDTEYDPEDGVLVDRLMGFIRMAKSDSYEIDCLPLIRYLSNWNHDSQWVQKRIARACFGSYAPNEEE